MTLSGGWLGRNSPPQMRRGGALSAGVVEQGNALTIPIRNHSDITVIVIIAK
jgi:hypothetical protein